MNIKRNLNQHLIICGLGLSAIFLTIHAREQRPLHQQPEHQREAAELEEAIRLSRISFDEEQRRRKHLSRQKPIKPTIEAKSIQIIPYNPARDRQAIVDIIDESEQMRWFIGLSRAEKAGSGIASGMNQHNTKILRTADPDSHLIGFINYHMTKPNKGTITYFGISQAFRGRGFGKLLMDHALADLIGRGAITIDLWVRPENPAKKMYEQMGFKEVGTVGKPVHSIIMEWRLD